jgi:hypothetical protein
MIPAWTSKKMSAGTKARNTRKPPTIKSLFDKSKLNKDHKGADINIDSVFPPGMANCTWTSETRGSEAQIIFYVNGLPYWYKKEDKTISHAVRLVRRD